MGDMVPQEGSHYAAISSGNCLVSADGYAIGGTSSMMILGPIEKISRIFRSIMTLSLQSLMSGSVQHLMIVWS